MAKKSDILLNCYHDFNEYNKTHKNRLKELEREFLHAKNEKVDYFKEVEDNFADKEKQLTTKFYEIELIHNEKIKEIRNEFNQRFNSLDDDIVTHNKNANDLLSEEDDKYQNILTQFEERKAEAFNTYLKLTKETNYQIDKEMRIHKEFIDSESDKLNNKFGEYQDLNSNLSNQLLWTMEKAKNALTKLSTSLTEEGEANKEFLDDTINQSLLHLNQSKNEMSTLFKKSTNKFESERDLIRDISKDKRKPHSEINQTMIRTFVKQIREVNKNRSVFESLIKAELKLSLSRLYPMIVQADTEKNDKDLRKYILQKEIIEKKATYLLERNKTMSDLLISKYQNEIKKIKIDSYKRFEEIKLAYEAPIAFLQNSINVYSNFAFYFNETYEDLYKTLLNFKKYNSDYIKYKTDYIHNSQKSFEDYKINLLVKVNDLTNRLTEYISKIDTLSNEIVTLESNNRLEIAEIRKRMENLEIFGDYQKYIASLENDQYFAMFQHNKNIEKIQIESNYKNNLLNINKEVLLLNQNKLEYTEYQEYMTMIANHEKEIHEIASQRKLEEAKALYKQKIDQAIALNKLAKEKIEFNARKINYGYAKSYVDYLNEERQKNSIGSNHVVDFIHHAQKLIDKNTENSEKISEYVDSSEDNYAYLRTLEKDRNDLLLRINKNTEKKNQIYNKAIKLYHTEILKNTKNIRQVILKNKNLLETHLKKPNETLFTDNTSSECNGHLHEITAGIHYIYKTTLDLAYKYQIPDLVKKIENVSDKTLGKFIYKNLTTYNKIKKIKSPYVTKNLLKSYYLSAFILLDKFEVKINNYLDYILEVCTKNDILFIENTKKKTIRKEKIINKEYDKLQYTAIKTEKSKKTQLKMLKTRSEKINKIYKDQVKAINEEYLQKVKESDDIAKIINKKFTKIVNKNNKELQSMLLFLDKLFRKDQKQLEKQYKQYLKSLESIEVKNINDYNQELVYINALYQDKNNEASKTIAILEKNINTLPIEKENNYLAIKKERYQLQKTKAKELQRKFAELEKDKFVSRPKYLEEIERVKNRLPEDYVMLYNQIQNLEFEYLNQFSDINNEYEDNYNDYLLNQSGNNELIEPGSALYSPIENMKAYYEKGINQSEQAYKDTIQKSKKTRENLKKQELKSKETQDRIINV